MATSSEVQSLYIAYFGRPADPEGLRYWTEGVGSTTPLAEIANGFATTAEFRFDTEGRPVDEVINKFYLNLFNRIGEVDGVRYWTGLVNDGLLTLQEVGLNIAQAALALGPNNSDRISEESKIKASQQWTTAIGATTEGVLAYTGDNGIAAGRAFLAPVVNPTSTPSVAATQAAVNAFIAGGGGGSNVLDLTINQDVFTAIQGERVNAAGTVVATLPFRFTATDQIVNGTAASFNVTGPADNLGDTLEDPSTADNDALTITNIGNLFSFAGAQSVGFITVSNIERVNLGLSNSTGTYDFFTDTNWSGVKSIVATGTISGTTASPTTFFNWASGTDATSWDSSAVDSNAFLTLTSGFTANALTVSTGDSNDNVFTSDGNDTIATAGGNDFVDADRGADTVTLGAGEDTFFFQRGIANGADGGARRTSFLDNDLNGLVGNGDTFNFAGPIDSITDFNQSQDSLDTGNFNTVADLFGSLVTRDVAFDQNYTTRGDWNGTTFTVDNAGSDILVLAGVFTGTVEPLNSFSNYANSNSYFVLDNLAANLTSGNFV